MCKNCILCFPVRCVFCGIFCLPPSPPSLHYYYFLSSSHMWTDLNSLVESPRLSCQHPRLGKDCTSLGGPRVNLKRLLLNQRINTVLHGPRTKFSIGQFVLYVSHALDAHLQAKINLYYWDLLKFILAIHFLKKKIKAASWPIVFQLSRWELTS